MFAVVVGVVIVSAARDAAAAVGPPALRDRLEPGSGDAGRAADASASCSVRSSPAARSSGLAGFLFLARFGTITVVAGQGLELDSVAAAVVGGVSVLGGSGTLVGAFLGAVLIDLLDQSLVRVEQVSEFWRNAILGVLILAAVIADVAIGSPFPAPLVGRVPAEHKARRQPDRDRGQADRDRCSEPSAAVARHGSCCSR